MKKVINSQGSSPTPLRARGMTYVSHTEHTHTGIINNTCLSDHAHVRARAIPQEFIAAWRERIFAEGMEDPVKVAVEEAIRDFGREEDFTTMDVRPFFVVPPTSANTNLPNPRAETVSPATSSLSGFVHSLQFS